MRISTNELKKMIDDFLTRIENEKKEIEIVDADVSIFLPSLISHIQERVDAKLLHEFEEDILRNLVTKEDYNRKKKISEIVFELD